MAGDATIGSAFIQLVPSAQGIGAAIGKELGGSEVAGAATQAGNKAGNNLSTGLVSAAGVAAKGVAVVGVAAVAAGAGLLKLGSTFDDAFDTIQVSTGASGVALEGLKDDFKSVFSSVPTSAELASTAISKVNQTLGHAGAPLQSLSKQFLEMSRITGTDLSGNIESVSKVFKNFGVSAEEQGGKLDNLFRVSQHTGVGVAELSTSMAENGVVLRQAGLGFDEAATFLGTLAKSGLSASDVMPALSKSLAVAAKDGKDAKTVLADTFNAIKNAPSDTAGAAAAMDVFGAKAGPKLAAAIREGKVSLSDLSTEMATAGDGIIATADSTADFPEKFSVAMNKAKVALEPLATRIFSFVGEVAEGFGNALPGILDTFGNVFSKIGAIAGPILQEIIGGFKAFIAAFKAGDGDVTSSGIPGFMEKVANVARQVFDAIKGIDFGAVFQTAVTFIKPVVDAIVELANSVGTFAVSAFQTLKQLIIDNQDTLKTVGETVLTVAGYLRDALAGAISAASGVFKFLANNMGLVKAVAIPLLAAFAAYKTVMAGIQVVTLAITIATKAWAVVQAALNVIMMLNPIGLVVAAIAALVAGVIYAYTHFEGFRNVVDTVWQVLQIAFNWVKNNWPLLLAILTGPIGVAVLLITKHWDTIKEGVSAMVDAVKNFLGNLISFFVELPGKILSAIGNLAGLLVSKGIELIQGFIEGYINMWKEVISFYISIPGRILGFIGNVGSLLLGKGVDTIQGLINGITSMFGSIASTIGSIAGNVISWIGNAASWLVDKGADVIRGFISGITSWISSIAGNISGIATTVRNAIGDAASWLYNAGRQIIEGLINGVKSMIGSAKDAVVSAAKQMKDAALGFLGISSPSKVFYGIGINVGEGLVDGLKASEKMVGKASASLAAVATDAASSALTFASPGLSVRPAVGVPGGLQPALSGASMGSTEINQHFHNANVDADQVAREVSWVMLTRGR